MLYLAFVIQPAAQSSKTTSGDVNLINAYNQNKIDCFYININFFSHC